MAFTVNTIMSETGTGDAPGIDVFGHQLLLGDLVLGVFGILLLVTGQMRARPGDPAIPNPPSASDAPDARAEPNHTRPEG